MQNTLLPNNTSKLQRRDAIVIIAIAFVVVSLFSTCSFLYPFNPWVDTNCIFTVGKSIFCGKVPYRDLMDHKGFLLHFIYGIGSLISFRSFFGLYILELVAGSAFLLACYKTLLLFTDRKVLWLMPFLALVAYGSRCFTWGTSAEEFCLPALAFSLYIGLRSVLKGKELTMREAFLLGILASYVFWIKYTMCGMLAGLWIGLGVFYIRNNSYRQLFKTFGFFCLGLLPITSAVILYYAYNHALSDLWKVYFYYNLFNYTAVPTGRFGLVEKLAHNQWLGFKLLFADRLVFPMLIVSLVELILRKDKKVLYFCLICFICGLTIFLGFSWSHYPLPLVVWLPFSLLLILRIFKRTTPLCKRILYPVALLLTLVSCCWMGRYKIPMIYNRDNEILEIGKLIMEGKEQSPSMIEYGILDAGVYTVCGYVPECKHFCLLGLSIHKEEYAAQENYITTCHPTFIISDKPLTFKGYNLYVDGIKGCMSPKYYVYRYTIPKAQ